MSGNFAETNINMLQVIGNELTYVAFATLNSAVTIVEGFISENTQLSVRSSSLRRCHLLRMCMSLTLFCIGWE